jgi:hypothetical protein
MMASAAIGMVLDLEILKKVLEPEFLKSALNNEAAMLATPEAWETIFDAPIIKNLLTPDMLKGLMESKFLVDMV